MRFILSFLMFTLLGFAQQTCQKAETTSGNSETAKSSSNTTVNNSNAAATTAAPANAFPEEAPRISLEEAKKAFDAGDVVFVDTRAEAGYKTEHIKGAINIPAEAFQMRYAEVPKGKKIIAYCSWPAEHTSARAVQILKEKGIGNAFALVGGTAGWKNAGYPMESGEQPK